MKYNQPYGISDPDAPYINGNPSTGTMGSIPPAESIEHPQREISNFINKSALTPTAADLFQLAKAVQSGMVNYGLDGGEPNKIYITPVVPIGAYHVGQHFIIKLGYGNTSQVTVNVSGLGQVPLIHVDGTPINAWELLAGQLIEVAYDGANFQAIAGVAAGGGAVTLTAPRDIYVNGTTGSDTAYDGTAPAVIGTMGGPFKTLEKALATMTKYNLGGWTFSIHVADGVYTTTVPIRFPRPNGSGTVYLIGNISNPAAVTFFNIGTGSTWAPDQGGNWGIEGFKLRTTAPAPGDGGDGIRAGNAVFLGIGSMHWDSVTGSHISMGGGGTSLIWGTQTIVGPAASHHTVYANGVIYNNGPIPYMPNLVVPAPITIGSFASASTGGQSRPWYDTMTGAGNVTGSKFSVAGNGVIDTGGRGTSYLPGTTTPTPPYPTGGQYL